MLRMFKDTTRLEIACACSKTKTKSDQKVSGGVQKYHLHETSQTEDVILEFKIYYYYRSKTTLMTK